MDHARQMSEEVVRAMLEALLKDDLRRIPGNIPTEALIGIYRHRMLSAKEREWKAQFDALPADEQRTLMNITGEHLEFIKSARDGHRPIRLLYLGLIVRRFGVNNIEPAESTLKNALEVNAANFLKDKRRINAEGIANAATILKGVGGVQGDPVQLVFVAEGIAPQKTEVKRLEASQQILNALDGLLGPIGIALASKLKGKE